ncbi:MAG: lipid-binding SYLF domain-containing protein, partial [Congregibacter sp.]
MKTWIMLAALPIVLTLQIAPLAHAQFGRLGGMLNKTVDGVSNTAKDIGDASKEMMEGPPPEEQRAELQETRTKALAKLYKQDPSLENELASAQGYAVFSNIGINLLLVSTQRGGGILRDNRSGDDIYMSLFSAGGGIGLGVKEYAAIFVFHTDAAINQFATEGWDFSGQADVKAQYK